ncbi:MAG TPA: Rho termination factor N-terminal domain-containing protein [Ktedonobacteraceae bacterium]|nr:Rho termination factor N-terminal domain-containing protein [Ktedonobacteraceae bacterium]
MDNVVPGALQRLRAADIMRMAGLTVASLGQEYCRIGAVQATKREGAKLSGVVVVNSIPIEADVFPLDGAERVETTERVASEKHAYTVTVEVQDPNNWDVACTCSTIPPAICAHATALLHQWLSHPTKFVITSPLLPVSATPPMRPASLPLHTSEGSFGLQLQNVPLSDPKAGAVKNNSNTQEATPRMLQTRRPLAAPSGPKPLGDMLEMLFQLGLGELRGIAREYEISISGLSKQELGEAILTVLKQPDAVRRVVATLDKPQRQLLATLTLAGGSITDDDLRSLFERFSLGQPDTLQHILLALQGKALLFRTSFNSSLQQRLGLSGSLLDIGWYVSTEVRSALRVHVPVTAFHLAKVPEGESALPKVLTAQPQHLLPGLLLVARALDGYRLEHEDQKEEHAPVARPARITGKLNDSLGAVPPPENMPSASMLDYLHEVVPRSRAFLRFAARLLRKSDILHKDDHGTHYLRALPNVARLFLGTDSAEVIPDLFELWLTRSSYEELYDLQEEGLNLYSRTTPLNQPTMRLGELETENSEARQAVVRLLAQAPLNQWMNFAAFARFVYKLNPFFLQKRQYTFATPHWWLEQEKGQPLRPTQPTEWMRAEGRYLARLIQGSLYWWGITDVALSESGNLLAFRMTPTADWLLHGNPLQEQANTQEERGATLTLTSSTITTTQQGALLVPCDVAAWPLIQLLEDFAEPTSVLFGLLCYRLSPKYLSQALSRGQQPGALFALLRRIIAEQHAVHRNDGDDTGLADQVTSLSQLLVQLERWTANYGRVRLYTDVTLLEVADAMVMRELKATTSLQEQVVQAIHPLQLLLKKRGAEQLTEDLKRRGQNPLLHEEEYYGAE